MASYDWDRTKAETIPLCQSVDFVVFLCGFLPSLVFSCPSISLHFAFFYPLWKFDLQPYRAWQFPFYFGGFSVSFPFFMVSVEHLISIVTQSFCKMFRLYFIVCFLLTICQSCRLIVPSELLNGCIFDPMIVSVSHAGFSINRDNCNTAIAKHVFAEQPLVYYGRAKSVIYFGFNVIADRCCNFIFQLILNFKKNIRVQKRKLMSVARIKFTHEKRNKME